ncbi:hypothetical protein E7T09_02190 [Deinococcus sp. KSM4-11]|uniref:LamG-like jellyroll fold domain-containing protein n=1 Tax=Deinococcus sp. KSM4-11 TaxID=2568654 RepID=UPI0010A3FA89|nr:LamG-like jellyroll fold domain-containing protein [Deinococcus sp. KSM4-11]THF88051.1 hypothetical protein E7T09_02190 [Deinococcus sp. KSM4-11]
MTHRSPIRQISAALIALAGTGVLGGCGPSTANSLPPAAPQGFHVVSTTTSTVDLAWSAVDGATGYTLERHSGSDPYAQVATPAASDTTFTDTGLSPSTAYTYRLKVTTAAGTSPYTADLTATTAAPDPAAPTVDSVNVVNGILGTPEHVSVSGTASAHSGSLQSVIVDWGESGSTPSTVTSTPGSFSVTHEFKASGTYIVKITARDSTGRQTTDTRSLEVTNFGTRSQAHFVFQDAGTTNGSPARDFSGNKRNGTYTGGGCFAPAQDRYSVANGAERFNSSSSAACTMSASGGMTTAAIPLPGAFTINVWVRPDADRLSRGGWLVGQQGGAFRLTLGTDGKVSALLVSPTGGPALSVTDPAAVQGDVWTEYVVRLTVATGPTASTLALYRKDNPLDQTTPASPVGEATLSGSYVLSSASKAWTVADAQGGSNSTAGSTPFSGAVDDLRFYDRALAGYEISALSRLDQFHPAP